ncbi:MAG: DUF1656 domain-containing protein [Marinilabiliales bacterium]|nr:MAG: DUF1656 domain-containing protein [Marinilabiliales bacterium]
MFIPHEIYIGEVFIPPMLVAGILGVITASITAKIFNKYHLSKHFFYPPLVVVALMVVYTIVFGWLIIPF